MSAPVEPAGPAARTGGRGSRLLARYGAPWWHLAALVGCLALTLYTVFLLRADPALLRIAAWFVGSAIAWDLLGGPLLALVDRLIQPLRRVGLLNPLRVALLVSGLLLLVWAPVIFQRSQGTFRTKAGLGQDVFLGRWLSLTAVLFAGSLLWWGVGRLRLRTTSTSRSPSRSSRTPITTPDAPAPDTATTGASRPEASRPEASRPEASSPEALRPEAPSQEALRPDAPTPEAPDPVATDR